MAEFFSHQTGVQKERLKMERFYEFQLEADPATFLICHDDSFLPDFKDIYCTIFFEDEQDYEIVYWDGQGKYFVVDKEKLCDIDKETAKNLILRKKLRRGVE